ncbi:MAG: deoxyribose-phosphate aldolase [Gracilibacteraceae bacterium]|jgi:deoxyribose-phosphate aldolase|nr:deoxyribose-phosphate aldolase [Gracilibacteraceae bacterium]
MEKEKIAAIVKRIDHTILAPVTTWAEIKALLDEAIAYQVASVALPMSYIKDAADYAQGRVVVQCPIGYPAGYTTTAVKVFEIEDAKRNGATEFDMVINLGWVKDKRWQDLENEIRACKAAAGDLILKVIVEAGLLTEEEKVKMCEIITTAGADFIKTATGYNTTWEGYNKGVATVEDVELFKRHLGPGVRIKAAGGMYTLEDAYKFVALGAERLGSKALLGIAREEGFQPET